MRRAWRAYLLLSTKLSRTWRISLYSLTKVDFPEPEFRKIMISLITILEWEKELMDVLKAIYPALYTTFYESQH